MATITDSVTQILNDRVRCPVQKYLDLPWAIAAPKVKSTITSAIAIYEPRAAINDVQLSLIGGGMIAVNIILNTRLRYNGDRFYNGTVSYLQI